MKNCHFLLISLLCLLPVRFGLAWSTPHLTITQAALQVLPTWQKDLLGKELVELGADYCLIPASADHVSFYQRIFGLTPVGEPRPYPQLSTPIYLMRANVAELWDGLIEKYPVFRSTFTERRMMFERPEEMQIQSNDRPSAQETSPARLDLN